MKLTIKHLAGYLPYGLKCHLMGMCVEGTEYNDKPIPQIFLIEGANSESVEVWSQKTITDNWHYSDVFPLLRPLSQLSQEIEHNGVRFVPKEWLRMNYIGENIGLNPATWSYRTIQKLQQWHFAIDIPSELYIEMDAIPTTKPNIA